MSFCLKANTPFIILGFMVKNPNLLGRIVEEGIAHGGFKIPWNSKTFWVDVVAQAKSEGTTKSHLVLKVKRITVASNGHILGIMIN